MALTARWCCWPCPVWTWTRCSWHCRGSATSCRATRQHARRWLTAVWSRWVPGSSSSGGGEAAKALNEQQRAQTLCAERWLGASCGTLLMLRDTCCLSAAVYGRVQYTAWGVLVRAAGVEICRLLSTMAPPTITCAAPVCSAIMWHQCIRCGMCPNLPPSPLCMLHRARQAHIKGVLPWQGKLHKARLNKYHQNVYMCGGCVGT